MEMVKRIPDPVRILVIVAAIYLVLKFGIKPPLPSSLIMMYMTLLTIGVIIYVVLFFDVKKTIVAPMANFFAGESKTAAAKPARLVLLVVFPFLVWGWSYMRLHREVEPPLEQRVIHPAPPGESV